MKNIKLITAILFTLVLTNLSFAQNKLYGKVTDVIDGRTIVIEPQLKVKITLQLQFIEVPEAEQKLHSTVKTHLRNMLLGKTVQFEAVGMQNERSIGRVLKGKVDVSQQMLRDGAAWYSINEKRGHLDEERELYEQNEAKAKAEKRGVWSVADLKPAWEFRAEKAEKLRQAEIARLKALQEEDLRRSRIKNTRPTAEERQQANANVKIWANTNKLSQFLDSGFISKLEKSSSGFKPISGYETKHHRNYVATPISNFSFSHKSEKHKFLGFLSYYSQKHDPTRASNYWTLGLISGSDGENFSSVTNFSVYADGKKVNLLQASRNMVDFPEGRHEVFSLSMSNKNVRRLKSAKVIKIRAGKYSGTLNENFRKKIFLLLDKVR